MVPFQQGLGLMIRELRVPVIPVRVFGMEKVFPRGTAWPERGKVLIVFGKPLYFTQEPPAEIVEKARVAVEILHAGTRKC
jgi:long-chain acyl-CoA synthetase